MALLAAMLRANTLNVATNKALALAHTTSVPDMLRALLLALQIMSMRTFLPWSTKCVLQIVYLPWKNVPSVVKLARTLLCYAAPRRKEGELLPRPDWCPKMDL